MHLPGASGRRWPTISPAARAQVERLEALKGASKIPYWAEQIGIQAEVVRGLVLAADSQVQEALVVLNKAADREDATEKNVVTPGPLVPAREVLAQVLLADGKASEALQAFEAVMKREPNRYRTIAGAAQAAEKAGDRSRSIQYYAELAELTRQADTVRPEVARARQVIAR